ncbi:TlyA family RNA methyltransferase [Bartonella sp. HY038]|uniref:TlyA family RNA methyltransferase n=1 Tax=Bartonella sp. HY038 TaxID=2759660 RepID=UPI001FED4C17|nr:TlyA family RNA methyltransferase [Bartonella sp. HY038]
MPKEDDQQPDQIGVNTRLRLDQLLVERKFFSSRSRARDAIERGTVKVGNTVITKAGALTPFDANIEVDDPAKAYVSRAALKLIGALDHFKIDVKNSHCIDVGASTGGFSQVLLERGASHVTAIDVGHGQFHPSLQGDPRITLHEGLNARNLQKIHLGGERLSLVVSDVSFISLTLALPPALELADNNAKAILLLKPQFEVGREAIGKGGLVKDKKAVERVKASLFEWLDNLPQWRAIDLIASPIEGGDGNQEFLLYGVKDK